MLQPDSHLTVPFIASFIHIYLAASINLFSIGAWLLLTELHIDF